MAEDKEIKYKNLVYLMVRKYKGDWKGSFPTDMGISLESCEKIYEKYADEVYEEIQKEDEDESVVPTADELIDKGMRKLNFIISSCDDASKLTRSIEILSDLRDSNKVKKKVEKTIFDKMQEKYKNEKGKDNS